MPVAAAGAELLRPSVAGTEQLSGVHCSVPELSANCRLCREARQVKRCSICEPVLTYGTEIKITGGDSLDGVLCLGPIYMAS